MNASILDVSLTLSSELLAEVRAVLVFDVFHNWIPTRSVSQRGGLWTKVLPSVIVDLVTVSRCVYNIQSESDTVFLNNFLRVSFCSIPTVVHILCDAACISVVDLTCSSGLIRPFESIKCDANIVLISVDFPSPVCPEKDLISLLLVSADKSIAHRRR